MEGFLVGLVRFTPTSNVKWYQSIEKGRGSGEILFTDTKINSGYVAIKGIRPSQEVNF